MEPLISFILALLEVLFSTIQLGDALFTLSGNNILFANSFFYILLKIVRFMELSNALLKISRINTKQNNPKNQLRVVINAYFPEWT
jgi:hypothetical protein